MGYDLSGDVAEVGVVAEDNNSKKRKDFFILRSATFMLKKPDVKNA